MRSSPGSARVNEPVLSNKDDAAANAVKTRKIYEGSGRIL